MSTHELTDEMLINLIAEQATAREPEPDLVYFIRGATTRKIKIGHSRNAFSRFDGIMAATGDGIEIIGFCYGGVRLEKLLHAHLKDYCSGGEWFLPEPAVLECIANVLNCNWHVVQAKKSYAAGELG